MASPEPEYMPLVADVSFDLDSVWKGHANLQLPALV
jgi:hypothetical protein